jgi:hypothetical protein
MNDDDLVRALSKAQARDRDRDRTARWERLAAGTASAEERAELAALAEADGDVEAMTALAPLDESILARIEARIEASAPARASTRRRAPRAWAVASSLALAAALTLVGARGLRAPPDFPKYAMQLEGEQKDTRGAVEAPRGIAVFAPNATFTLTLRPPRDVAEPVAVVTAQLIDGVPQEWHPPTRVSPAGVAEIAGRAADVLGPEPGEREIVVAIGRHASLPRDAASLAALAPSGDVRVFRAKVRLAR